MRLVVTCVALGLALPALAFAQPAGSDITVVQAEVPLDQPEVTVSGPVPGPLDISACSFAYRNQLNYLTFYPQNGFELMDDLHTNSLGMEPLCAYEIGFYNLSGFETSATVTIYQNDAQDDPPGKILAGPFRIDGLPVGLVRVTYYPLTGLVTPDVWMGVKFSAFRGCGLQLADPVQIGQSHDIAYSRRFGYVNFGGVESGHLPANFVLALTSTTPPVPTQEPTWGALKARYR